MTDRLIELAALWGVETRQVIHATRKEYGLRPRLDIAHDLLAKLPERRFLELTWEVGEWRIHDEAKPGEPQHDGWFVSDHDSFESAVIELAERAGVKP